MLMKITAVEARLFFREPGVWLLTILLPTIVLVAVGVIFGVEPDPALGGQRWIDIFAPSMVVMTLAILGVNLLPARLVKYREKGVMRRLSTTPARPQSVLTAQFIVNMGVAIVSLVVLIAVGNLMFQIPFPKDPIGFAAASCSACRHCSPWACWSRPCRRRRASRAPCSCRCSRS